MIERSKALTIAVVLVFVSSALSFYAGAAGVVPRLTQLISLTAPPGGQTEPASGIDQKQLRLIKEYIQSKSLYPVSDADLTEGALKGMVAATQDKYSAFYDPKEFDTFVRHFEPSFSGIGVHVELSPKTGLVTVVSPIKGSPGDKAGIRAGDAIVEVDGKDLRGMTLDEAVTYIRGPKGTKVKLKVAREGETEALSFEITRATIEIASTEHKLLEDGVGYLQVKEFNEQVSERVKKALAEMKAQGMTRLVLDLRQNPGGLLDEAINVSSQFAAAKEPVVHVEARGEKRETYPSLGKERFPLPLVVLVDGNSASASEIVAGAIKDLKIGTIMGVKTFGKGTVQTFFRLEDGSGIKLTTARYLTAGGNSIHEKGIEPDVVVENPAAVRLGEPGDVQLQKAIEYVKTLKR